MTKLVYYIQHCKLILNQKTKNLLNIYTMNTLKQKNDMIISTDVLEEVSDKPQHPFVIKDTQPTRSGR